MPVESTEFLNCRTRAQLATILGVKLPTLTYFAYGNGKKYTKFRIPKKGGDKREILAPTDGLKSIQRKLAALLGNVYPAPPYVNGFIYNRSIVSNALPHVGRRVVFNIDLKNFFPSITAPRVIGLFKARPFNFSSEVASTLAGLTCYENSLPQGAPTSPVVSNLICYRLDRALSDLARHEKAIYYTRYADDITFSTSKRRLPPSILVMDQVDRPSIGEQLGAILKQNYFEENPGKTRVSYGNKTKYVTGVKVNTKSNVSRDYIRQLRAMLNSWNKYGIQRAQNIYRAEYGGAHKDFIQVVRGKIAHLKNIKGPGDLVYRRLHNKFVTLEDKGKPALALNWYEENVEKILVINANGKQGTGFILNETYLVTCSHVVSTQDEVKYHNYNNFPSVAHKRATVDYSKLSAESEFDIAFLTPDRADCVPVMSFKACPSAERIQPLEDYFALGFPAYRAGMQPNVVNFKVTRTFTEGGIKYIAADKMLAGGNSGGPVLNKRNEVVGIVVRGVDHPAKAKDWPGYTVIPMDEVRRCAISLGISL